MIYAKWLVLVLISFVIDVLGVFVVPVAIAFSDGLTLPRWAWAWDNDEEPLGDTTRNLAICQADGLKRGYLRYCWLAWRNPGHNFSYMLGFDQLFAHYSFTGDPRTSDQGHAGTLSVKGYNGHQDAFCFYGIWPSWIPGKCRRVFIGWKIHDMSSGNSYAQLVCVYNPFMTFEKAPS